MEHLINWVEIPVTDIERAKQFYSSVLGGIIFRDMDAGDTRYALFPASDRFNCGALVQGPYYTPSRDGIGIYLDGGKDMSTILEQVVPAGGQVLMPKTHTGMEAGYIGMFLDTEGNKIGLQHM